MEESLNPFLEEKLPALGLDVETYGPYLLGLLPSTLEEADLMEDGNDEEKEEEWENVLQLLQASSETHSEDEEVWLGLKKELSEKGKIYFAQEREKVAAQLAAKEQAALATLAVTKKAADVQEKETKKSSAMDEATKKSLLAQYAYVNEDEQNEDGGDVSKGDGSVGGFVSNKDYAKQANVEKNRELKNQNVTTKREEQQKTKQARLEKARLKEERRNRATKGERKR